MRLLSAPTSAWLAAAVPHAARLVALCGKKGRAKSRRVHVADEAEEKDNNSDEEFINMFADIDSDDDVLEPATSVKRTRKPQKVVF